VILDFADQATEDLYNGSRTKAARRCLPLDLWAAAQRLEALKGDYRGYFSIRVNDQYRIVFQFENGEAHQVQIVDYH
jgi:proteic killer suppression protein